MRTLLSRIMGTRSHAIIVAALSLVLPPFGFVCGSIIGLVTLRHGLAEGLLAAGLSMFLAGVGVWLVLDTAAPVLLFAAMTGVPVLLLATTLRSTQSLATTITLAGFLGIAGAAGLHMAIGDPSVWWRTELYDMLLDQPPDRTSAIGAEMAKDAETLIDALVPMMGALPAGAVFGAVLTLLLARWWHAVLDKPGGFGNEFRALRFPRWLALVATVIAGITMFAGETMGAFNEFLQIMVVLYLFQGLAIAHGVAGARDAPMGWLVALYAFLFLIPVITMNLLVVAGLVDPWFGFRARAADGRHPRGPLA